MIECKHENWGTNAIEGEYCLGCGKSMHAILKAAEQQLIAEQAKSLGLEAKIGAMHWALEESLSFLEIHAEDVGYGEFKPDNPHDFTPDFECCTSDEIKNWVEACKEFDSGLPVTHTGWGIGSYVCRDEELCLLRDKVKQAISEAGSEEHIKRGRRIEKAANRVLMLHERYRTGHYHANCDCGLCKAMKALYDALGEGR